MLKKLKAMLGKSHPTQLERLEAFDLSGKPFTKALVLRAATLQDEAQRDLRNQGLSNPIKRNDSLDGVVVGAAATVCYYMTIEAAKSAGKEHVFLPFEPVPRTANVTAAFSLFLLATLTARLKEEGVVLDFPYAATLTASLFYFGHPESEQIAHIQLSNAAFKKIAQHGSQNVEDWHEGCQKVAQLFVLQWTTDNEKLKQQDLLPMLGKLLASLLKTVE